MTREEFAKVVAVLAEGCDMKFTKAKADVWFSMLRDLPYEAAATGVTRFLMQDGEFPSIAKIRRFAVESMYGHAVPQGVAFGHLLDAIRRYGCYDEDRGMASLDQITRLAVRGLGGWQACCESTGRENLRAQFRMAYEGILVRLREDAVLPDSVKPTVIGDSSGELRKIGIDLSKIGEDQNADN